MVNPRVRQHQARVAAFQFEFGIHCLPPDVAMNWSNELLRSWFEAGGVITLATAEETEDDDTYRKLLDLVGVGLPFSELEPTDLGPGGLLGAAAAGTSAVFERLADALARDGWVLCDLLGPTGGEHQVWPQVCKEGRSLLPHMKPGILESADGTVKAGKSPSGKPRGDVYMTASEAAVKHTHDCPAPALALLDTALGVVGHALAPAIERHPKLGHRIRLRTDPFFKCFPGGAAEYGAHFDGGRMSEATKLTAVLYCNQNWRAEAGGQLRILDEKGGCWRSVTPHAGRLILFLVKDCLHKVEPCHATRFALTNWWMQPNYRPGQVADVSVTVRSVHESGPQRYAMLPENAKYDVLRGLDTLQRRTQQGKG